MEQKTERAKWNGTITERQCLRIAKYFEENGKIEILSKIRENIFHSMIEEETEIVNGTIVRIKGTSFDQEFKLKSTIKDWENSNTSISFRKYNIFFFSIA